VAVGIVGDGDVALDVVQDSFIKAYYKLKEFRFGSNFYTWFYRLLVNQAIDRWRSRRGRWRCPLTRAGFPRMRRRPTASHTRGPLRIWPTGNWGRPPARRRRPPGVPPGGDRPSGGGRDGVRRDRQGPRVFVGTVMSRLHYARGKLKESLKSHRDRREGTTMDCGTALRKIIAKADGLLPREEERSWRATFPGARVRRGGCGDLRDGPALRALTGIRAMEKAPLSTRCGRGCAGIEEGRKRGGVPRGSRGGRGSSGRRHCGCGAPVLPAGTSRSPFHPSSFDVAVEDVESDVATVALVDKERTFQG